jgi:glycosyltransferase involved in cell wall biosynthesis
VLQVSLPAVVLARMISMHDLLAEQLTCHHDLAADEFRPRLASIVLATRSRPEQLRRCLASLTRQKTTFPFEIVVIDNDPGRGLTAPVIQDFPQARCIAEPIQGLAQARNTGFRAAHGEILVATDDDVVAPESRLQELVQPFRFAHVGITTGLVAPLSLEHRAQREFERVGGLGKGSISFEVGVDWLAQRTVQPPRTWDLGATANAAFRREVLEDPRVGLLPESLGPGTPAGGGEDAYLFYRAVRMGYGVYYEAHAMLHHEHRADDRGLRRQMFDYARGHVAYLLTTLVEDGDLRAVVRLVTVLPAWHLWRLLLPFHRRGYRRVLVLAELAGYVSGPWGWLQGRRRDARHRRAGRIASSTPLTTPQPCAESSFEKSGEKTGEIERGAAPFFL